jgi:hypothetical protein
MGDQILIPPFHLLLAGFPAASIILEQIAREKIDTITPGLHEFKTT